MTADQEYHQNSDKDNKNLQRIFQEISFFASTFLMSLRYQVTREEAVMMKKNQEREKQELMERWEKAKQNSAEFQEQLPDQLDRIESSFRQVSVLLEARVQKDTEDRPPQLAQGYGFGQMFQGQTNVDRILHLLSENFDYIQGYKGISLSEKINNLGTHLRTLHADNQVEVKPGTSARSPKISLDFSLPARRTRIGQEIEDGILLHEHLLATAREFFCTQMALILFEKYRALKISTLPHPLDYVEALAQKTSQTVLQSEVVAGLDELKLSEREKQNITKLFLAHCADYQGYLNINALSHQNLSSASHDYSLFGLLRIFDWVHQEEILQIESNTQLQLLLETIELLVIKFTLSQDVLTTYHPASPLRIMSGAKQLVGVIELLHTLPAGYQLDEEDRMLFKDFQDDLEFFVLALSAE